MDVLNRFAMREDFHQALEYARIMESIGWSSIPVSGSRVSVRQLGPISIAKMQRPRVIDFDKLKKIQATLRVPSFVLEPSVFGTFIVEGKEIPFSFVTPEDAEKAYKIIFKAGFHISSQHYAHSKSALIDIASTPENILKSFSQTTRYNVKRAERAGVEYSVTQFKDLQKTDREEFFSLHGVWSKEKRVIGFSHSFLNTFMDCFPDDGCMVWAKKDEKLLGAMLVMIHDHIGYYFYTCTNKEGRSVHVPTGLTWRSILLSKEKGADIFDFCSVYDERFPKQNPRWKGFTTYKFRFNPTPIYYPPTFVRGIF